MDKPYDDTVELEAYVRHYVERFVSDLELRSLWLCGAALRIQGLQQSEFPDHPALPDLRERGLELGREFIHRGIPDEIQPAVNLGYYAYRDRIHRRLFHDALAGRLSINRCPKCSRIARTPTAKQCRWCRHTWRA